jgi:DNA-binding CsgD family transcriptional regulator
MTDRDIEGIPEREREVLRLLVHGHDAKSIVRALGLSVNVVNERLRDSRRRLGVSSSREAARLLAAHEGDEFLGDKEIGLGAPRRRRPYAGAGARRPSRQLTIGLAMIFIAAAALALSSNRHEVGAPAPTAPPRVVATRPARGAIIAPGPFLLTVTFDQPMTDQSYSYTRTSPETYPDCAYPPILSHDARTFTLRCTAAPGRQYEIWFNRQPYMNFRGLNGVSSEPYQLLFRTRPR